jgi:hypothetical protein
MGIEQNPQIVPDLIWRVLDNETVVLSPSDGVYCVLNSLGTEIWQLLSEQHSLTDIEHYLVKNYEVSEEQAREDVARFLTDLAQRGLLVRSA